MIHMDPCTNKYVGLFLTSEIAGVLNSISNDSIFLIRNIDSIDSLKNACHVFLLLVDQVIYIAIRRRLCSNYSSPSIIQNVLNGFSSLNSFASQFRIATIPAS